MANEVKHLICFWVQGKQKRVLYSLMGIIWEEPCTPPMLPWPIQVDTGTKVYILIGFRQGIKNVNTATAVLKPRQHKEEGKETELYWFPLGPERGGSYGYSRSNHFLKYE